MAKNYIPSLKLDKLKHEKNIEKTEYSNDFEKEVSSYSITPRTYLERSLIKLDTKPIVQRLEKLFKKAKQEIDNIQDFEKEIVYNFDFIYGRAGNQMIICF